MKQTKPPKLALIACLLGISALANSRAGTVTYDFTTDPTTGANPIQVFSGFLNGAGDPVFWKDSGGNPGGFLGLTWPIGSSSAIILFPDIDQGKIVTAFTLETDLRIGNPQQTERAADGFSINFARANDPVFENHAASDFAVSGAVETGTTTGIAISFDTWSGNQLPDGADIEGIIVRVDNKTVLRQAMPTRNGACDDPTSLQTGSRNTAYWDEAKAAGTLPDAALVPESWTNLCWQHLIVDVDDQAKLSVTYKGTKILDKFQTTFFPSAGGIVLAGRTGNADEHGHFDNLKLTTSATASDTVKPTLPANLRAAQTGAYRVELAWDPSTDNSGRVGYDVEQDGVALGTAATPTFVVRGLTPLTSYVFRIRATDVSGNKSDYITLTAKTIADVEDPTRAGIKIYGTTDNPISGAVIQGLLDDGRYPDAPDRVAGLNGMVMSFGEPAFGDTFGENLGFRIAGTLTPAETASYRFFVRSDDASQLYLNKTDAAIPFAEGTSQIAEETDCCDAFLDPGVANDDTSTFATSAPIALTAGKAYGILFIVKEGGGGDWGQVAWRKEGDTTPPANLAPIGAPFFKSEIVPKTDPLGIGLPVITAQPKDVTVGAGASATFTTAAAYGETPFTYQWQFKGKDIAGATKTNLTVNAVTAADAGAYTVIVGNTFGSVTSQPATLTLSGTAPPPVITDGLVAYWNFDGNLLDTIKDFDGTAKGTNALAYVDSKAGFGKAIDLNGTDQYVDITGGNENDLEFPGGSMSIAGWFKVRAFDTGWQALIAKGEGSNYRVARRDPTNSIAYAGGTGEGPADSPNINDGNWHHFVAVTDAKTNKFGTALYIDGVIHEINKTKPVLASNSQHLFIGENPEALKREWNGQIDDIAIWSRVLTDAEITSLYNGGTGTPLGTLLGPSGPSFTSVEKVGTNLVVAWSSGTLEEATTVNGPYTAVANATSPATIPITGAQKFLRLK